MGPHPVVCGGLLVPSAAVAGAGRWVLSLIPVNGIRPVGFDPARGT